MESVTCKQQETKGKQQLSIESHDQWIVIGRRFLALVDVIYFSSKLCSFDDFLGRMSIIVQT